MDVLRSPDRLTCGVFVLLLLGLPFLAFADGPEARGDTRHPPPPPEDEAAPEFLSLGLGDSEVSLFLSGFWKGTFSAGYGIALTPLGLSAATEESPFLFTQEADLTLSLWIRRRWFVEAGFLDDYNLNTYRAGYQGLAGEAVQYVGIGNTGLDFPAFPYLDLGGNSPSSFGVYGRFGSGTLALHGLVRYDAAVREERVFVGNRERAYSHLPVEAPLRGLSFVLPDEHIGDMPVIYIEDSGGDIRGSDRRRWRRARPGEYAVSARYGTVELRTTPKGRVAAAYGPGKIPGGGGYALGSYGTGGLPGTGFLGEVQDLFDGIPLNRYPQSGQDDAARTGTPANVPGLVEMEGNIALLIYEPGAFSPFERQSRYRSPTSNSSGAALVRASTGDALREFEVNPVEELNIPWEIPDGIDGGRKMVEIQHAAVFTAPRSPEARWPLAKTYPEIYLPGTTGFTGDVSLRFTNYGASGAFVIGTDAAPGSVQVFREGLLEPNFTYNESSGEVNLRDPPGANELIRIRYLKKSDQLQFGSLAAGLGVVYNPEGPFSSGLALGLRWNVNSDAYSEEEKASPGTVGLSAETALDFDRLKAKLSLGLGFEQPDTTGLYRVAGMEGAEITLGMSAAFIAEPPADSQDTSFSGLSLNARAPLVYRNYQNPNILGSSSLLSVDSAAPVIPDRNGPYPVLDSSVSRETLLAAEFTLTAEHSWTGFQIPLGEEAEFLERAQEIGVPFRLYGFERESDIRVIVQFGALAAKDSGEIDNPALIAAREIYPANHLAEGVLKLGRIGLSDEDRRKLRDARYMRLLIIRAGTGVHEISGRVLAAPPYALGAGFRAVIVRDGAIAAAPDEMNLKSVSAVERRDLSLGAAYGDRINRLHPENAPQRVLELRWRNLDPGEAAGTDGRTASIPLAQYRRLSFFFKAPEAAVYDGSPRLRFLIAQGPGSLGLPAEIGLEADIPLSAFSPGRWVKVDLYYGGGERRVLLDGSAPGGAALHYRPDFRGTAAAWSGNTSPEALSKPGYIAVFLSPQDRVSSLANGGFSVDEITLEDPAPAYRFNGGASLDWRRPGPLVSLGGYGIVEDLVLGTTLESGVQGDPFTSESPLSYGAMNRSSLEFSLLGARLSGNIALAFLSNSNSWNAGHGISRRWGPFTAAESFSIAPADASMTRRLSFSLETLVKTRLEGDMLYRDQNLERNWQAGLGIDTALRRPLGLSVDADAHWIDHGKILGSPEDYGETWVKSWGLLIPNLGAEAKKRDIHGLLKIPLKLSPVGAELSADGRSVFSRNNNSLKAETQSRLDLPFIFGGVRGLFRGERSFSRGLLYPSRDALDDGERYYASLKDSWRLWLAPPLYALFDPLLPETMSQSLAAAEMAEFTEYGLFSDGVSLTLELPQGFDLRSLFLPHRIEARFSRNLHKKLDVFMDVFNIGSALRFSAINMFGAFGVAPVFPFYQSEELNHSLEAQAAIPKDDLVSWRVQDEHRMTFYGFTAAELALINTLTLGSSGWQESLGLEWTAPAPKSILGILYLWLSNKARDRSAWPALSRLAAAEFERLRKETLEMVFEQREDSFQSSFILGHESIIRILGRLYLSAFAKLNCRQKYDTGVFSFTGTIGATLNVSF